MRILKTIQDSNNGGGNNNRITYDLQTNERKEMVGSMNVCIRGSKQ